MDRFPILYTCSSQHEMTIDSVLVRPTEGGPCEWDVTFVRDFNDWEIEVVMEFFQLLTTHSPTNEGPNGLRWKLRKDGILDSRSFYYALVDRPGWLFPWKD